MITESELLAKVPDRLFIGGEWVESTSGRSIEVKDPSTGAVIKTIADESVADAAVRETFEETGVRVAPGAVLWPESGKAYTDQHELIARTALKRAGTPAPQVIGIDEIAVRKGHSYRIVVSDLVRKRPIWFGGTDRSEVSMAAF